MDPSLLWCFKCKMKGTISLVNIVKDLKHSLTNVVDSYKAIIANQEEMITIGLLFQGNDQEQAKTLPMFLDIRKENVMLKLEDKVVEDVSDEATTEVGDEVA